MNRLSVFYEHIAEAARQTGLPMEEICSRVKGFGFDAVELDAKRLFTERETLLPMLWSAGLQVNCLYYFFNFGSTADWEEADKAEMARVLDVCEAAKSDKLLAVAGFLTEAEMDRAGEAYRARRERIAASLAVLVRMAQARGITIVMEDFDGDTAPFSTAEELLWFMENVPGMRCGFDTGNFLYNEEDAVKSFSLFRPYIASVHCKDRAFTENTGSPCVTVANRKLYPVAVGDGNLPIEKMMRVLLDSGYTGSFAAEHFGSIEQLKCMERSAAFLKRVLGEK